MGVSYPSMSCNSVDEDSLAQLIRGAYEKGERRSQKGKPTLKRELTSEGHWLCTTCKHYKPVELFTSCGRTASGISSRCLACNKVQSHLYMRTLRGNAVGLVLKARRRDSFRGRVCTMHMSDILDKLWEQKGRCYYSQMPMEFIQPNSHWRMSLERIDNRQGYSVNNCVLVAADQHERPQ